jgi:predicted ATP-grasp superfamily ATP-dependent carboligase
VEQRRSAPDPRQDVHGFIARLEELVRSDRYDILLPGTDAALLAVSRHRDRLVPYVKLGLPAHDVVERALNRSDLAAAADRVGLAPPEQRLCVNRDEAASAANAFGYPVLVKPVRTAVERDGAATRWASALVRDRVALEEAVSTFGQCIVQRRLSGRVVSFGGVVAGGELLGFSVSRYVRTWPPDGGNVSFSETVAAPTDLPERVLALVAELGWEGMFELELVEAADASLSAIDFNPRAYGSLSLAVAAGTPIPALWCAWLMGERRLAGEGRSGLRYRWEDAEVRQFAWRVLQRDYRGAGTIARPAASVTHAYYSRRDPLPSVARWAQIGRMLPSRRRDV